MAWLHPGHCAMKVRLKPQKNQHPPQLIQSHTEIQK